MLWRFGALKLKGRCCKAVVYFFSVEENWSKTVDVWVFYPTLQCEQAHVYVIHMQYCVCQVHFKYCFKGMDCWLDDTFARAGLQTYLFICCFIHFWLSTIHSVDMSWYILLWQNMHLDRNRKSPFYVGFFWHLFVFLSVFNKGLIRFSAVSHSFSSLWRIVSAR